MSETNNTTLIKYDAARTALIAAKSVDEVLEIKNKAEAMRVYAKQAGDIDMQNWAAEIRIRAERKYGLMRKDMDKNKGGNKSTGSTVEPLEKPLTIAELGVSKSFDYRAQKMAEVKEEEFESIINEHKEKQQELTSTTVRRLHASAEKEIFVSKIREGIIKAPEGLYDVIVLDPPWEMEKIDRDVSPAQVKFDYPTMDEEALTKLKIPFNIDSHVFMWTTHKYLPMALRLFDAWSVKYVLTMVWHKNGGFQPFNLPQYNCEFILYGRIGVPLFIDTKAFNVCFNADRTKHSEKPEEFYELLRRVTGGRRLDMFNRREIDGFDTWGNESGNY